MDKKNENSMANVNIKVECIEEEQLVENGSSNFTIIDIPLNDKLIKKESIEAPSDNVFIKHEITANLSRDFHKQETNDNVSNITIKQEIIDVPLNHNFINQETNEFPSHNVFIKQEIIDVPLDTIYTQEEAEGNTSNRQQFKCPFCNKLFNSFYELEYHKHVHAGHSSSTGNQSNVPALKTASAAPKTRAQIQREYRQRIAASQTPAQAAAAKEARNERLRNNRLRQAANLAIASGSLEAVASTSATPLAEPITAAPKTRAQIQREYRQRIAATRTPEQAAAAREARNERLRKNRLRRAANLAAASGSLEAVATPFAEPIIAAPKSKAHLFYSHIPSGNNDEDLCDSTWILKYDDITKHKRAYENFNRKFRENPFGYSCTVCNRLWFKNDLKKASVKYKELLMKITNINTIDDAKICASCKVALDRQIIPILSTYNGFEYPKLPAHLPKLDLVSERLISPRLSFMQIRRLRHVHEKFDIYGQIINVPVSVDTMVNQLPRDSSNDHCIYVHINKKRIHKSNDLQRLINKKNIKTWLQYLINTPLFNHYNITINHRFLSDNDDEIKQLNNIDEVSEEIPIEESLTAQQQTLLWNYEKYLRITPGEYDIPRSLFFDEHAEELSFPTIYLGHSRTFKDDIRVTPFMMASSELRRTDRRAITPHHLLYIAVKIMRLRIRHCLRVAYKHISPNTNITREQILSDEYINNCFDSNLAFLRSIPNSTWYWAQRRKDLFAMIRQRGRPTAYMKLSANEIGWTDLIQLLYKLANNGADISERFASELSFIEKSTLVNEDAVTCAIYFNKLVNVLLTVLQNKECTPFGRYRVSGYFKRVEFEHCGSPHAHILLWLENAPDNMTDENNSEVIDLIDSLVSVSPTQASGNINLQIHKHTFACDKKIANQPQKCRFEAPFMPCRKTMNLTPMQTTDEHFQLYTKRYAEIRSNLESTDYSNIDEFYAKNNINSDDEYCNILRAGITKRKIFYKRCPTEKWFNPFNPFVFNIMRSSMDFQIITDEYSCAAYVLEYVNKTNRGVSDLQRKMIEVMNEHPEFDIVDITRKMSVDILNNVEMSSSEAAWYLLREPMSNSSVAVHYINTVWPMERQRIRKTQKELTELDQTSTDIYKEDWFYKYQQRPDDLGNITLAQFVAKYYQKKSGVYAVRIVPQVIRFRNYDIALENNEYRREMVTLHIPFRNEEDEILDEMKFINIYEENEAAILERRKEFESNFDIETTIGICRQLCREEGNADEGVEAVATQFSEPITAAPKSKAQKQREYRQRIAASRTPAQAAAAREARNVRLRNNKLRRAANLVISSGSLEATTTSSCCSGQMLNTVHINTQKQFTDQQRQTLGTESAETTVQPSTS